MGFLKFLGVPLLVALVISAFAAILALPLLYAWIADVVYSRIFEGEEGWPDISYWLWVGIVYLFLFVTGRMKFQIGRA